MRSDDEDEEEDFDEENEDDEGDALHHDIDQDEDDAEGELAEGEDEDDPEGDGDDDEGGDEGDDDDEEDAEGDEDEDDDEDNDEAEEDEDEDGDADGDDEDADMDKEAASSPHPSQGSTSLSQRAKRPLSPSIQPEPPHRVRRSLLIPSWPSGQPPASISLDAVVAIPIPAPIHCLASTACASYLLAGSQEGFIRAYDFYASVNGQSTMTALQRAAIGLGEGVSKVGVPRGWWSNEISGLAGQPRKTEPVYSMVCEGDGLWTLAGSQSGPINLYTLRHSPGQLIHTLKGHTSIVSCMTLLPDEKSFLSGSWDGTIRMWDLNTGQTTRTYPTHGGQLSSLSLRPHSHPLSPGPSPQHVRANGKDEANGAMKISVSIGADFFDVNREVNGDTNASTTGVGEHARDGRHAESGESRDDARKVDAAAHNDPQADVEMAEKTSRASSFDPLFDEDPDADAEGEEVDPSGPTTSAQTPAPNGPQSVVMPIQTGANGGVGQANGLVSTPAVAGPSRLANAGAAANIPLLSPANYRQFSDDILLASFMDGQVSLIDRRVSPAEASGGRGVGRLLPGDKAPPWCMSACWSGDGNQVLAGRRNGTIDVWDVRRSSSSQAPNLLRTLKTPTESGAVSCVVAFPDGKHIATASQDNIRLWNTAELYLSDDSFKKAKSRPPFKIVAGHHGGTISSMSVDPTCRFLITASGDRGWAGEATKLVLIHEVKW